MKNYVKLQLIICCMFFALTTCKNSTRVKINEKKNILLIIVDDLRTELGCYGKQDIITPNIDSLAEEGVLFSHAYCQKAICVPSRQSFLTGMRPNTFGAGFNNHFRDKFPDVITLPQLFKKNGYKTFSVGKVFHHRDPVSWDTASWVPEPELCYPMYVSEKNRQIQKDIINANKYVHKGHDWWAKGGMWVPANICESPDVADDELLDGKIANYAIEKLNKLKNQPFFLAVGFFNPHIPFIAPKKYYDLYSFSDIELPFNDKLPEGAPSFAKMNTGEWRIYHKVVQKGLPNENTQKEYILGYRASVSFVDAQIGRIMKSLKEMGLEENTIVVFMSDHGYHLFDNESFGKKTIFENGTRVPLIVKIPGNTNNGKTSSALVELVDIYPTLCELADLPEESHLEGKSFVQGLNNISDEGKKAAYSQFNRKNYQGNSVRTKDYRYNEWINVKDSSIVKELYQYSNKFIETKNKINQPDLQPIIEEMARLLHKEL